MFKKLILVALWSLLSTSTWASNSKLEKVMEDYYEEYLQLFPMDATDNGDHRYDALFVDSNTAEFRGKLKDFYKRTLTALDAVPAKDLDDEDQVSADLLRYDVNDGLEGLKFDDWKIPFHQFWGMPQNIGIWAGGDGAQPFETAKDYENWLSRLTGFVGWLKSAEANFKEGVKSHYVLPRSLTVKTVAVVKNMITADVEKSLFYKPILNFKDGVKKEDRERLAGEYRKFIRESLNPAMQRMVNYLNNEYLPHTRSTAGVKYLPGGAGYYAYLARHWTTTEKSPDEIFKLGMSEVARIEREIQEVRKEVGFKGSLLEFYRSIEKNPKLTPFKKPEEILDYYRGVLVRIEPKLKEMFGKFPKTKFEVRQTQAFRAASASAEYDSAPPDGSRPAIFYVPIIDATKYNAAMEGMESLFLHEAIPGHHFQISLQHENKDLPKFRQFNGFGAYAEGWALYCESLGKELGIYTDPYQRFGALTAELHRALRLVLDVGIHVKGWSRERAIGFSLMHEAADKAGTIAEIERYMAIPGQALSYKIGALKIRELREKYAKELGAKFRLSSFHDAVLSEGSLPLAVLEQKMARWAKEQ